MLTVRAPSFMMLTVRAPSFILTERAVVRAAGPAI